MSGLFKKKKKQASQDDKSSESTKSNKSSVGGVGSASHEGSERHKQEEKNKDKENKNTDKKSKKEKDRQEKKKRKQERKEEQKNKKQEKNKEKGRKKHLYKSPEKSPKKRGMEKQGRKERKKKRFSIRGFSKIINLQEYLEKAGIGASAKEVSKKVFRIILFISLLFSLAAVILCIIYQKGLSGLLAFILGFWIAVFPFLLALAWIFYLFYLDMMIFQRTKDVEAVFPDFLQLTSANISAGMPIDRALWYAVRPGFGVLAKEIESVAKNTMAGEDLGAALTSFARKYDSKVIQRSINLLLEGMAAGGEMADLLSKIALNIEETRILKKEMAANVTTYVIFISFATILAAPVLFGLATQLLIIIKQITSALGQNISSASGFFSFSFSSQGIKVSDFKLFSYLMLIISSISSACIVSVIRKGRVKEGLSKIPVFVIVSVILYTLATIIIGSMFTNFI